MTFKDIQERLTKCELTLEKLRNSPQSNTNNIDIAQATKKLEVLKESFKPQPKVDAIVLKFTPHKTNKIRKKNFKATFLGA